MSYQRPCACPHGFPVCACGSPLAESRRLSALAGWPGRVTPEAAARVLAAGARPTALDAERCPHRVIPECGCAGMACGPGGRRQGERVTIRDCVACLAAQSPG